MLFWRLKVTGQSVQGNARVPCGKVTLFATRNQVWTVEATPVSHVVAFVTKACACQLISVLVASLLTTLADTIVYKEVVTNALSASIRRVAQVTPGNSLFARLADAFIQVVPLFTLKTPLFRALLLLAMLDKAALFAIAIAREETFAANCAAPGRACLAVSPKSVLTGDALTIKAKISLFALLALEPVITFFAVDVHVLRTQLANTVLHEGALDASLV